MNEDTNPLSSIKAFREGLKERFPHIRPYSEDDWDWTWADEGMEFLEAGDFGMAELKFQELIAAQPEHPDGYEGLALVYQAIGRKRESLLLIEEAVRIARDHFSKDWIDEDVLNEIEHECDQIRLMQDPPPNA